MGKDVKDLRRFMWKEGDVRVVSPDDAAAVIPRTKTRTPSPDTRRDKTGRRKAVEDTE